MRRGEGPGFDWPVEGASSPSSGPRAAAGTMTESTSRHRWVPRCGRPKAASSPRRQRGARLRQHAVLKHPSGWVTAYAHNQELLVQRGEAGAPGQVIARVGSSGSVDRPQLHFEVRKGKQAVDPMRELSRPSAEARERDSG